MDLDAALLSLVEEDPFSLDHSVMAYSLIFHLMLNVHIVDDEAIQWPGVIGDGVIAVEKKTRMLHRRQALLLRLLPLLLRMVSLSSLSVSHP